MVFKRTKRLSSNTTLRGAPPEGNSRNFINMQPTLGQKSFKPTKLGCADGWTKTGGNSSAKVDKL